MAQAPNIVSSKLMSHTSTIASHLSNTQPTVILITGLPCSGKTTIARQVSKELACAMFSKDDFKERLAEELTSDSNSIDRKTSRTLGIEAEEQLLNESLRLTRANTTHVVESVFRAEYINAYLTTVSASSKLIVVVLRCRRDVLVERFAVRKRHWLHDDSSFIGTLQSLGDIEADEFRTFASVVLELDTF